MFLEFCDFTSSSDIFGLILEIIIKNLVCHVKWEYFKCMYDTQLNRYIQFDAERQNDKDVRFCAIFMQFLFHGQEKNARTSLN